MEPSIKNAEYLLYSISNLKQRLANYERKLSKAIQRSGPSGLTSVDLTKPFVQGSRQESDLADQADEISRLSLNIQEIKDESDDVLTAVSQLSAAERRLIELWYFKRRTKREIADVLHYSATKSVYALRERAITRFIELYPW